jgi:hypothetical protein
MFATASSWAVRPLWLCVLGVGFCASAVRAQSEDASPDAAVQPVLRLELSNPVSMGLLDKRIAVTGWYGSPSQRASAWGLGLALPTHSQQASRYESTAGADLGLRWRSAEEGLGQVHLGLWQRVTPDAPSLAQQIAVQPSFDTRLEMQFSAASARGIRFELGGALGMQLNKDEKIMLRAKRGKPMVYYRALF